MVGYWCTILLSKHERLTNHLYRIMRNTDNSTNWLNKIKNILDVHGLSDIWINQTFPSKTWLGLTVERRAKDQFIQKKEFTPAEKLSNHVPTLALKPNPFVT